MLIPFKTLKQKYGINPTGVLHVGASTGQEAKDYYDNGIKRTIWIEAIPKVYRKLCDNIRSKPNAVAINACVTDKDGEILTFNISNNEAQSSSIFELGTHANVHPEVRYIRNIQVRTFRIDNLFEKKCFRIEDYTFLNLDIQGAELLALKGMGDMLNKVQFVYCEVNKEELYKGCPLVDDITAYLAQYGFKQVELDWCGNFGWGDAFYIKS